MRVCWPESGGQVRCEPPNGRVAFPDQERLVENARLALSPQNLRSPQTELGLQLLWLVAHDGTDLSPQQAERIVHAVFALLRAAPDVHSFRLVPDAGR